MRAQRQQRWALGSTVCNTSKDARCPTQGRGTSFPPCAASDGQDSESFRMVRCGECQGLFYLCRRDDRGNRYCPQGCQELAWRRTRKGARRRHQQSELGREDHRDAQRRYRANRRVMDQGSRKLAPAPILCGTSAPAQSIGGQVASDERTPDEIIATNTCGEEASRPIWCSMSARQVFSSLADSAPLATSVRYHPASVYCAVCGHSSRFVREVFAWQTEPRGRRTRRGPGARAPTLP